jgi:hypothetical protein
MFSEGKEGLIMGNQQAGDSPMSRAAGVSAFQLYDLVTATNGDITYEQA